MKEPRSRGRSGPAGPPSRDRRRIPCWTAALACAALGIASGCAHQRPVIHERNPLGWPARGAGHVGWAGADSGRPVLREGGRWLLALGRLLESPALLVEGVATLEPTRLLASGECLVVGSGQLVTATMNLPLLWVPGGQVDIAADVDLVNEALARIEEVPPEVWRSGPDDPRTEIFPPGTRARASGCNLVYEVPGRGEVIQAAEENRLWDLLQAAAGTDFSAQERSWGFVARSRARWEERPPRARAITTLHEFHHQQMQMREWLLGWTVVYWPAYLATYPFTGWYGHWAEMAGSHAAGAVDRALGNWTPGASEEGPPVESGS